MWNYIYYYVYVSRIDPRDRSAIQKYVHDKVITFVNIIAFSVAGNFDETQFNICSNCCYFAVALPL